MNLVKEHKGVKIFVSIQGEFYCDANTNSNDYKKKTFVSTKLQSIEKAIDDFKGQEIDGNIYYDIAVYNTTLTPLRIVRQVGNRLFFDDGTDTSNYSRRNLYPKSIDEKQEFKDLELLFEKLKDIYQNCYKPSAGPGCQATDGLPSCCFGTATSNLSPDGNCP